MKQEDIRKMKARAQRLETLVQRFEADVELLYENEVNISENEEVRERQNELQDEMEQTISDLLLLLDTSGSFNGEIELPENGRRPVSDGSLPQPTLDRPEGRGTPAWARD
jgi:SHS2 domain-containing protein